MEPEARGSGLGARRAGFSLLELVVVAAIIVMVALMAIPSVASSLRGRRLGGAEQTIKGALLSARTAAIAHRAVYSVEFAMDAQKIYVQDESNFLLDRGGELPDLVVFDKDSTRTTADDSDPVPDGYLDIRFGPDGSVLDAAGKLQIGFKERGATDAVAEPKRFRQILVNRWTGMAKLKP